MQQLDFVREAWWMSKQKDDHAVYSIGAVAKMLDVPFAAVHRHVAVNEIPPLYVDDLIAKAYQALIAPARTDNGKSGRKQDPD